MGNCATCLGQPFDVGVIQPYTVSKNRAFVQQTVSIIDIEITPAVREKSLDPGDLVLGFSQVRMYEYIVELANQLSGAVELLG